MFCDQCGQANRQEARFCQGCGATLPHQKEQLDSDMDSSHARGIPRDEDGVLPMARTRGLVPSRLYQAFGWSKRNPSLMLIMIVAAVALIGGLLYQRFHSGTSEWHDMPYPSTAVVEQITEYNPGPYSRWWTVPMTPTDATAYFERTWSAKGWNKELDTTDPGGWRRMHWFRKDGKGRAYAVALRPDGHGGTEFLLSNAP